VRIHLHPRGASNVRTMVARVLDVRLLLVLGQFSVVSYFRVYSKILSKCNTLGARVHPTCCAFSPAEVLF
jgi:hypothetical protein